MKEAANRTGRRRSAFRPTGRIRIKISESIIELDARKRIQTG